MQLEKGDVLIQGDEKYSGGTHALMWIGGEKPLVHSSNDKFLGVLEQSMGYISKYIPESADVDHPTDVGVYRYTGATHGLAVKAAYFAHAWATRTTDINDEGMKFQQRVLGTPFSTYRLGQASVRREATGQAVSVETIFRVLKAIARTEMGSKLSPNHGVSCSQFVVYCYQAAALSLKIGGVLPPELIKSMGRQQSKVQSPDKLQRYVKQDMDDDDADAINKYWRDKSNWVEQGVFRSTKQFAADGNSVSLLAKTLQHDQKEDFYKRQLPVGMDIDPMSYGVNYLCTQLKQSNSSFTQMGHLHGRRAVPGKETAVTWDIRKVA